MTESYKQTRYRTDEKYREKVKKQSREWFSDNKEQRNTTVRKWYANRTPEQIQARKDYLKKRSMKH